MELKTGAKLGPYEILSRIGEGGMGQVWKARDTRLDRTVAIKTSAARFSERFEREARAVAALNHPHICTLYDVGPDYLVMEYVEGSEIKGPLPLDQALKYAIQLASALEAAHKKLITHRDLKPANILLAKSGVKVLDFGLAKTELTPEARASGETVTRALTQEGSILGTLQYMAPEQLQGKVTDVRADIFSFGCVLYEMLTGKRAFDATNTASVIAAILERPAPSVAAVGPPLLDWTLQRCLAKEPDERWQSAADLRAALEQVGHTGGHTTAAPAAPAALQTHNRWLAIAAGVFALAAGALALIHFSEKPPETPVIRFFVSAPPNTTFPTLNIPPPTLPALSPDGHKLVFRADSADGKAQLWVRSIDAVDALPIANTEGGHSPFWSPDGKSIGFISENKLRRIETGGGPALTIADLGAVSYVASWGPDGTILLGSGDGPLRKIAASGGSLTDASRLDAAKEDGHFMPWFLPDGRHFLFIGISTDKYTIRLGSLGSFDSRELAETDVPKVIYASGYLLFLRAGTLMAQPFDAARLSVTGDAVPVAEQIEGLDFSASANGTLVYVTGATTPPQLTWFDRAGKPLSVVGEPAPLTRLQFSPDGRSAVAVESGIFWIYDLARGLRTRFNFGAPSGGFDAVWSPDGSAIVFNGGIGTSLFRKASNGSGADVLIWKDNLNKDPLSFSPDGKMLAYDATGDPKTRGDIWILPDPLGPAGSSKPYPLIHTEAHEGNPQISPDGKWIAWESDESGRSEIYAEPFPGSGGKRQISTRGGSWPRWRRDGAEIFYVTSGNLLAATAVAAKDGALEVGETHELFRQSASSYRYDVSADGQKFLIVAPQEQGALLALTVVFNWPAGLKK